MTHLFHWPAAMLLMLLCSSTAPLLAQAPQPGKDHTILHVKGLDPAARDSVVAELGRSQGAHLVYACIPAGILVFGSDARTNGTIAKAHVLTSVEKHTRARDITVLPISQDEAEARCAQARNR